MRYIFSGVGTMWRLCLCVMWICGTWVGGAGGEEEAGGRLLCKPPQCIPKGKGTNEYEFLVEGRKVIIEYMDGSYLKVQCGGWRALDSSALPRFKIALRVSSVTLERCPPPAGNGSFASTLAALNVTFLLTDTQGNLSLDSLPLEPPLAATHFAGFERLVGLKLIAMYSQSPQQKPAPTPGFLARLQSLRSLVVKNVQLPAGELDSPPPLLRHISLRFTGMERLPEAVLSSSKLRELVHYENNLAKFAVPPLLRTLALSSANTTLQLNETSELEILTLEKWAEKEPTALSHCDALLKLQLSSPALDKLPKSWVAACPRLETLALQYATGLKSLPSTLLKGAKALVHLTITRGALETLPEGLLDDVINLKSLDLMDNKLRTLPSGLFAGPSALKTLNLSANELDDSALDVVAALRQLTSLNLANNKRIRDVCETGYSKLYLLTKLTFLSLRNTKIFSICRDWRESMTLLKTLDLRNTNVSQLWYDDLQYRRDETITNNSEVLLDGAPITVVEFTYKEYENSLSAVASGARVQINSLLACDCRMYWTRLALERARHTVRATLACGPLGRLLDKETPESLECPAEEECLRAALHPACECRQRPAAADRWMVRARCDRLGLRDVPRLPAGGPRLYRLQLPNNNISRLRAADLPHNLKALDLRNNSLSSVDEETAAKLGRLEELRVAGNPLACDCRGAPLLSALRLLGPAGDLPAAACADRAAFGAAPIERCAAPLHPAVWAVLALAAALALAASIAAYFSPPERRMFLKVVLHRWGVLRRAPSPLDRGLRFDAFVSFAHEDEDVVRELVRRLEGGPAPYRLCLHYRDWVPGRLIPDQIQESVRQSRRTLALVSRHFLRSTWACAEFREAHAHALRDVTPRLVVVLLEEPARLPLDAALRRYLACNTYVRWGDPWFWDKLALALPPPRPPSPRPVDTKLSSTFLPPLKTLSVKSLDDRPITNVEKSNSNDSKKTPLAVTLTSASSGVVSATDS